MATNFTVSLKSSITWYCCFFMFNLLLIITFFNGFFFYYSDHLQKVLDNSDLNLATEMHLLLNSSTIAQGTVGHFRNLIMGESILYLKFFLF